MNRPSIKAVVIGGSAGALQGLSILLQGLPANYDLPIFITVHVPSGRKSVLAEVLQSKCQIKVREAQDKEPISVGNAYVAPPDYHLLVEKDGTLALSSDEPIFYSRPALDVLFESAADAYGPAVVGVVLSGASGDGAKGLQSIEQAGGVAIIENPDTAYASIMPQAALNACSGAKIFSLDQLAEYLKSLSA
jgi:two-component system, chemotaxis family, protein-glutamate methylesterase/glutaminase